jgi:hypothetical protein
MKIHVLVPFDVYERHFAKAEVSTHSSKASTAVSRNDAR